MWGARKASEFDNPRDLFAYIRGLPWRSIRITKWGGKWSATCVELATHCEGKA